MSVTNYSSLFLEPGSKNTYGYVQHRERATYMRSDPYAFVSLAELLVKLLDHMLHNCLTRSDGRENAEAGGITRASTRWLRLGSRIGSNPISATRLEEEE